MELTFINITALQISATNVRKAGKASIARNVDDLIPSIRSLGVLQPLLVRECGELFEIIAGQRRYHACVALAEEDENFASVPCMIMDSGDDAKAIEASLAENVARLPMDEIDQYRAFAALVKNGSTPAEIAEQFGVTERLVTQRLAIANLYAPILNAYRRDEIDTQDMRNLRMATKRQQKAWWALHDSEDWQPTGRALKHWLFGGATIPDTNALFNVEDSDLVVIGNLFGEERYFADSAAFWPLQSAAVAEMAERYRAEGWQNVVVHEIGERFHRWNYEDVSMEDGGEVHITLASDGEVTAFEGVIDRDVLRKRRKAESGDAPKPKPEITKAMQNYLALHRHAAVRRDVLANSPIALRLIAAHMIAGSGLWDMKVEPQKADKDATAASLAANPTQIAFDTERTEIAKLLQINDGESVINHGGAWQSGHDITQITGILMALDDADVTRILAFLMAETLETDTALIEYLGLALGTYPAKDWQPDEAFVELLRDKQVINAMVSEAAGESVAKANLTATAKVQKGILTDCLIGTRKGAAKDWTPRYMAFPIQAYTDRGGIRAIELAESLPSVDETAEAKAA